MFCIVKLETLLFQKIYHVIFKIRGKVLNAEIVINDSSTLSST